jgi:DNA mismatch repair protein MutS2
MKIFPEQGPDKLGFGTICQALEDLCLGVEGKELARTLHPRHDAAWLTLRLRQTAEMKEVIDSGDALPAQSIPSVSHILTRAEVAGNYIDEDDAYRFLRWLQMLRRLKGYFENRAEKYPALAALLTGYRFDTALVEVIEKIIGADGRMLSTASKELNNLRRAIADKGAALRQTMERLLRQARDAGYTADRELTIRNERLVIPVNADHKGRMAGVVHDVSQTGQTVFIEPLEVLALNNELRELRIRERQEMIRILTALTDQIRPGVVAYRGFVHFVAQVDLVMAAAQLAVRLRASLPKIHARGAGISVLQARHPLLVLQRGWDHVVPLNLKLSADKRVLVISGPNAGGKSVALKTVGLLQLMVQSGLLVPAGPDSEFGLFGQLFVDIGDDQSIQNDLSTYSSHLAHMRDMLQELDDKSLFLIDEFGTGTDPQLGGPIAEALLEDFLQRNAYGVVTTHYSNLKDFATRHAHTANAAMQFDVATLRPTYVLEAGHPGSSYAFELAQRAGIPAQVLNAARQKMGSSRADVDGLLVNLQQQQALLEQQQENIRKRENELADLLAKAKARERDSQNLRRQVLEQAQETAAHLLADANARIEHTIREIREQQAEKEATRTLRKQLDAEVRNLILNPESADPDAQAPAPTEQQNEPAYEDRTDEPIAVGDWVRLAEGDARGQVVEVQEGRLVVAFGELRSRVRTADVIKVAPVTAAAPYRAFTDPRQTAAGATVLDVRGQRVEPALQELDRFIDQALLAGLGMVTILHGKGSGALRAAIRQHLQTNYQGRIAKLEDAAPNAGGSGQTLVYMR